MPLHSGLFALDAERAHRAAERFLRVASKAGVLARLAGATADMTKPTTVFGLTFRNPVGLAAGFDKDAKLVAAAPQLGFGFMEIGTVTPRPQPGNPVPRLFRDKRTRIIFNQMGFNNGGAEAAARRLEAQKARLPGEFRVGVNVGKNKDTPESEAAKDYATASRPFRDLADFLVINVSSPNTPGLRALQSVATLGPIVDAVQAEVSRWGRRVPVVVKLAPEITGPELREILSAGAGWGLSGWVLTNTLGGTWPVGSSPEGEGVRRGGLSGSVLSETSRERLKEARSLTPLPVISVGGILDSREMAVRFDAGAQLVEIYSGWIFGGIRFVSDLVKSI